MANYATTTELQARFNSAEEVALLTHTVGTPDTTVLTDMLESAEGDINSRIGKRYATPVVVTSNTELTALMKRKTLDLAEFYLLREGDRVSDLKEKQGESVLVWANKIGDGTFILSGAVTPPSTASRDPLAAWTGSNRDLTDVDTRIFSRETMAGL